MAAKTRRKNLFGIVWRAIHARPRMVISLIFGAAVLFFSPSDVGTTRALLAWNATAILFIVLILVMMGRTKAADIRDHSTAEEEGRFTVLTLVIAAAVMALIAIGVEIFAVKEMQGTSRMLRLVLTFGTVISSWAFVHVVFAIYYAHEFHAEMNGKKALRGGLRFPGENLPDYWDFIYFSFTVGMTAQTSDVVITSRRMRRLVIVHGLVAFVFTTAVIALTVNLGAQLVG
ncbi:MAG TPA: DUF1345 domain-containing protein [Xanthobacteraceae bacterium]